MTLLAQLNPAHDAPDRQAVMRYDDGTYVRVSWPQFIVQGRKPLQAAKVEKLIAGGKLVMVACQMWSRNEIWRPACSE